MNSKPVKQVPDIVWSKVSLNPFTMQKKNHQQQLILTREIIHIFIYSSTHIGWRNFPTTKCYWCLHIFELAENYTGMKFAVPSLVPGHCQSPDFLPKEQMRKLNRFHLEHCFLTMAPLTCVLFSPQNSPAKIEKHWSRDCS